MKTLDTLKVLGSAVILAGTLAIGADILKPMPPKPEIVVIEEKVRASLRQEGYSREDREQLLKARLFRDQRYQFLQKDPKQRFDKEVYDGVDDHNTNAGIALLLIAGLGTIYHLGLALESRPRLPPLFY